jgi:CRP-like cAMP-binding protein
VGKENIFPDVDRALEAAENRIIEIHSPEAAVPHCRWDFSDFAILGHLEPEQKGRVKQIMQKRDFRAGETIFEEGEPGDSLFLIACGYVSILGASGPKKDMRFTSLGPGLYFGEMALLEQSVRSARAVADEDCELYVLQMEDLEKLMEEDAMIGTRILQTMAKGLSRRLRLVSAELTALESV